jgi:hypothetical protein
VHVTTVAETPAETQSSKTPIIGYAVGVGLVVLSALGGLIGGLFSYETLFRPFAVCSPALEPFAAPFFYAGALVLLTGVFSAAGWLVRRDPERWGFAGWILAVAIGCVLCFGWLALITAGLWEAGHEEVSAAESWAVWLLALVAMAGPSIASFGAAMCVLAARSPRVSPLLAPLVFLVLVGISIAVLALHSAAGCGYSAG